MKVIVFLCAYFLIIIIIA